MRRIPVLPDRSRPLLFAHRGCSSLAPENTMASFRKAKEFDLPGIELDIHLCASGELVVAHDDTFQRTAGDPRNIEDLTFEEIRSIDVGSFFDCMRRVHTPPLGAFKKGMYPESNTLPKTTYPAACGGDVDSQFKHERVLRLEEVLEEFCPGMYIDIELKTRKTSHDDLPEAAAKILKAFGARVMEAVTISSFNPFALRTFKKYVPEISTALIWSRDLEVPRILRHGQGRIIAGCDYLKPEHAQVKRANHFIQHGPIIPWTIDDADLAKKMIGLGVEGIISNKPQEIMQGIGNKA